MYRLIYLYLLIYHVCVCVLGLVLNLLCWVTPHNSGKPVQIRKLRQREITLPEVTQCQVAGCRIWPCPCFPWHHAASRPAVLLSFRFDFLGADCAQTLAPWVQPCHPCTAFFSWRDFTSCSHGSFPTVSLLNTSQFVSLPELGFCFHTP